MITRKIKPLNKINKIVNPQVKIMGHSFTLKPRLVWGWYDVYDQNNNRVNKEPLRKREALNLMGHDKGSML